VTINALRARLAGFHLFVPIGDFTTTQKSTFYTSFYALPATYGTPLRRRSRGGQYYAGLTSKTALDYG